MRIIKVGEFIDQTCISRASTVWEKLIDVANEEEGEILFDFEDVILDKPHTNDYFKELIKNQRVFIKVYTDENLKNTIEMTMRLAGLRSDRVFNEDIIGETYQIISDTREIAMVSDYEKAFEIIKNKDGQYEASFDVDDVGITQIESDKTIKYIEKAFEKILETIDIKVLNINLRVCDTKFIAICRLSNFKKYLEEVEIKCNILAEEPKTLKDLDICLVVDPNRLFTRKEKIDMLKEVMPVGSVGMLTEFAKGKPDYFGRSGGGKTKMRRVSILREIGPNGVCVFDTFVKDTFSTIDAYMIDNQVEEFDGPTVEKKEVDIANLGICDLCIGNKFHYNAPIQLDVNAMQAIYIVDGDKVRTAKKTLPEFIKIVLDDNEIEYDVLHLMSAIAETKRYLTAKEKREAKG